MASLAKGTSMTEALRVSRAAVEATINHLRHAGLRQSECVALWLARRTRIGAEVVEVYRPEQVTAFDSFRIPPSSMNALLARLGDEGLFIGAQVHSHPQEAFHSEVDDRWAIIRHVGAISIVVPYFADAATSGSFFSESALFVLDQRDDWVEVPPENHVKVVVLS
jgi:proteasome lid subunit RPN8/RPN11